MPGEIKRIYIGLPHQLVSKVLWVERRFRTNSLSHQPGGYDVVIEFKSKNVLGYDWIKKPSSYVDKVLSKEAVKSGQKNYADLHDETQLIVAKELIKKMYARNYENDSEYETSEFKEVWDSEEATLTPRKALEKLEDELLHNKSQALYDEALMLCKVDCNACFVLLDELITFNPGFRSAYVKKLLCTNRNNNHEIVDECKKLLLRFPLDDEIMGLTAFNLFAIGKYTECYDYCDKALKINPFNSEGLFYKARIFSIARKSEKYPDPLSISIKYYKKYIDCLDKNPTANPRAAYNNLGVIYQGLENNALAAVYYHKALRAIEEVIEKNGLSERYKNLLLHQQRKVEGIEELLKL